MALITQSANVFVDANQPTFGFTVVAAEAITAGMACALDTAGKAIKANNTNVFAGFAAKTVATGKPVTLYRMARLTDYAASMAEGTVLYMAGAGDEGKLSDAPIAPTDPAVAFIISTTDICVKA